MKIEQKSGQKALSETRPKTRKKMLAALSGERHEIPPVWLMRQAGRYLPEYRAVREKVGGFLTLVYNPDLAAEVTLQPIRRYGFDAAILFSDILVVPHALGQEVRFEAGEGPRLSPIRTGSDIARLSPERLHENLSPVYETVSRIRAQLTRESFHETALIGFAGAPWTIACYMVEGGGSKDFTETKRLAYTDPEMFSTLLDLVTDATIAYLLRQVAAGAEIVKIFDSWAGVLDETLFERFVIAPAAKITAAIKKAHPDVPVIAFPRGGAFMLEAFARRVKPAALALDTSVPLAQAAALQKTLPVQGLLDPACLLAGGAVLSARAVEIVRALSPGPFIFNLGHGIHKDTPPENVDLLLRAVREFSQ